MSSPEISQVLAQMRVVAARAEGVAPAGAGEADFGDLLKNSIKAVNDVQQQSSAMKHAFELGDPDVDLASVMIASEKASVSFQAMVQVRNKLLEAYKDVMNMAM
ncbi:MAG: flagellar hook-basal body complex protein FliE [Gammaproteobacteria bacterium]|jgi:flagellar hook-basal body complex protein FliE